MKYVVMLCCLLFAVRAFATNFYFEQHVTLYAKSEARSEETGAKVMYVHKAAGEGMAFELTIIPDGEEDEPIVVAALVKPIDDKTAEVYSADGKQRIGTATAAEEQPHLGDAFTLDFALFYKGMKMADVNIDNIYGYSEENGLPLPTLHMNFKLIGTVELSFESDLSVDMAKTMRCSEGEDTSDC